MTDVPTRRRSPERSRSKGKQVSTEPARDESHFTCEERAAFIAERVGTPLGTNKNRRKQIAGTNIVYSKANRTRKRSGHDKE